jgi:predicted N-acetyltransferase YhbS
LTAPLTLCPDGPHFDQQVDALYARAFGPGRFAKAAARLREGNVCLRALSFVALDDGQVIGACRLWPVVADDQAQALFLGPIAVDPDRRSAGLGKALVVACLQAATAADDPRSVILVGDLAYFGPLGFAQIPKGEITLPGPVDPARLLWRVGNAPLPKGRLSVLRAASPQD